MGTFQDSASRYSSSSRGFSDMGLVVVGERYAVIPECRASTLSRAMWKGSLTRITVLAFALCIHDATAAIDSPVECPSGSSTTDVFCKMG